MKFKITHLSFFLHFYCFLTFYGHESRCIVRILFNPFCHMELYQYSRTLHIVYVTF